MAPVLPRRLAPVLPTTYSWNFLHSKKAFAVRKHVEFPYHACAHCKGFASAAPRRARTLVSVSFSGLPLSRPLQIFGLVVPYTTNSLICCQLILRRRSFKKKNLPVLFSYKVLSSVSRSYPLPKGRLPTCYWAFRQAKA